MFFFTSNFYILPKKYQGVQVKQETQSLINFFMYFLVWVFTSFSRIDSKQLFASSQNQTV